MQEKRFWVVGIDGGVWEFGEEGERGRFLAGTSKNGSDFIVGARVWEIWPQEGIRQGWDIRLCFSKVYTDLQLWLICLWCDEAKTTFGTVQCSRPKQLARARSRGRGGGRTGVSRRNAEKTSFRYGGWGVTMGYWVRKGKMWSMKRGIHRVVNESCSFTGSKDMRSRRNLERMRNLQTF